MSLATRCTACGTVFRVVQDQLKVSEGWVRCGRCDQVFNAFEGLFDLERDLPADHPAAIRSLPASAAAASVASGAVAATPPTETTALQSDSPLREIDAAPVRPPDVESTDEIHKIDAQLMHSAESGSVSTPAKRVSERDRLEFPDAQFDADMLVDENAPAPSIVTEPFERAADGAAVSTEPTATPQFVQHAQRQAHRRRPGIRARQTAVVAMLLLGLGAQIVHVERDTVAARWPATREALSAWCGLVRCTIDAPRRIDDVVVESTALARSPIPEAFTLSVVLRNRGTMAVKLPSVDLSLTDANGRLVSRRMFAPRDFGTAAGATPLAAGGESSLQLTLATDGAQVAGYTVEVFYP